MGKIQVVYRKLLPLLNKYKRTIKTGYISKIHPVIGAPFFLYSVLMLVLVVVAGEFAFSNTSTPLETAEDKILKTNSFKGTIDQLEVPEIPDVLKVYMDSQLPELGRFGSDFDWFDFYDPKMKTKVEVKYSGLNWAHHESLLNRTITYKFNGKKYRLKALASELTNLDTGGKNIDNPIGLILSEHAVYNVAKQVTNNTPASELVYLNDDSENLFVRWKDNIPNLVRENDNVPWTEVTKVYLYAWDKQDRFFDIPWKTRNDKTNDELKTKFIELMNPILAAVTRDVKADIQFMFPENDYYKYMALDSVFGSGHMERHNLVYQAQMDGSNNDPQSKTFWVPIIYDLMGIWTDKARYLSPFYNHNYISEYILRHPRHYYNYLKELAATNTQILENHLISNFYKDFDCPNILNYPGFTDILASIGTSFSPSPDINEYCEGIKRVSNYETIRSLYLKEQLGNSTLHWNMVNGQTLMGGNYLVLWVPSPVPVKLEKIECAGVECSGKWQLTNAPWWEFDKSVLSPLMVRINGGYTSNGTGVIPQPYYYFYKWGGLGTPHSTDIQITAINAVTNEAIYPVKDDFPILEAQSSLIDSNNYTHKVVFKITNFTGSDYQFGGEIGVNKSKADSDWRLDIKSSKCKLVDFKFPDFTFDCSDIKLDLWPYVLDYDAELYYKKAMIREVHGEFFQDYKPKVESEELNSNTIIKFKLKDSNALTGSDTFNKLIASIKDSSNKETILNMVKNKRNVYYLPAKTSFELTSDLVIDDGILFIDSGVTIKGWPLTEIKTDIIFINGDSNEVILTSKDDLPGWYGISVKDGGIIQNARIDNTVNLNDGAISGDGVAYLALYDTKFANNKSNVHCSNCVLNLRHVLMNYGEWAVKTSNSTVYMDNVNCSNTKYCFGLSDTYEDAKNIYAANTEVWVFNVNGAASDLRLDGLKVKNVGGLMTKRYAPYIEADLSKVDEKEYKIALADLDTNDIYKGIANTSPDDFYNNYKKYLDRDNQDRSKFYVKDNPKLIKEDMIIPGSVTLIIRPGTKIKLSKGVNVLSYGKIESIGTASNKIVFTSEKGDKEHWGVLVLRDPDSSGVFKNTVFEYGGSGYLVGYDYTGALTAHYASRLEVESSSFTSNNGDDSLNCKHTFCVIKNNYFEKNSMDGVDLDFAVSGSEVVDNTFIDNGGDAIDISFDNSLISGNNIKKSGDKCISVGESSFPVIYNNSFSMCSIGVEAKDASRPILVSNQFNSNGTALNAYQKKRRFPSGGIMSVYKSTFDGNRVIISHDALSQIDMEDKLDINSLPDGYQKSMLEQLAVEGKI